MRDGRPWYMALWAVVDASLRRWAATLQKMVGLLRLARALLWTGLAIVLVSALLGLLVAAGRLELKWFLVAHAVASLFLVIPLAGLAILVALPLRAKSVVRLVDMGYPANARELAIRVLARKLRDESIETEELLVETAINEARKAMRRVEERRRQDRPGEAVDDDHPGGPDGTTAGDRPAP